VRLNPTGLFCGNLLTFLSYFGSNRLDLDGFPWIDMTMSMSMSMKVPSTSPSRAPVVSPSPTAAPTTMVPTGSASVSPGPTRSSQPSAAPSVSSAPTGSSSPSAAPSISSAITGSSSPSAAPSISSAPTGSSSPSAAPSISSAPTGSSSPSAAPSISSTSTFFQEEAGFTCTGNGVELIEPPFETATAIDIQVVYLVKTFAFLDDYNDDLQDKILASAVIGALQCNTGGPLFGQGGSVPTINIVTTLLTGEACPPDLESVLVQDNTNCNVFETSFQIIIEEDFDPAVAALLAYIFIRDEMSSGAFVAAIPLFRVEYLRPVLPIETPEIPNIDLAAQVSTGMTVSPWTIGAFLAMCKYIYVQLPIGTMMPNGRYQLLYLELFLTVFLLLFVLLLSSVCAT
jgi:hypothetical protein